MVTSEDVLSQAIQNNAVLGGIDLPVPELNFDRIAKELMGHIHSHTYFFHSLLLVTPSFQYSCL